MHEPDISSAEQEALVRLANAFERIDGEISFRWENALTLSSVAFNSRHFEVSQQRRLVLRKELQDWFDRRLLEHLNDALKAQGRRQRLEWIETPIGSFVRQFKGKTKAGALYVLTGEFIEGDRPRITLKTMNRVVDKRKTYSMFCNGQPGRNLAQVSLKPALIN